MDNVYSLKRIKHRETPNFFPFDIVPGYDNGVLSADNIYSSWDMPSIAVSKYIPNPKARRIFIDQLLKVQQVALLSSPSGMGKTTFAKYSGAVIALASACGTSFLGKFDIRRPGKVLLVLTEDDDEEVQFSLHEIVSALSLQYGIPERVIWQELTKNLFIKNLYGQPTQLFNIDARQSIITPTENYFTLNETCKNIDNLVLVVLDTRTRLSGAEGQGNAIVAKEVALYEQLAAENDCVVLLTHHTNKASYSDFTMNGGASIRGETALRDCVRTHIQLKRLTEKHLKALGIPPEEAFKYMIFEHEKTNHFKPVPPFIIKRDGGYYETMDLPDVQKIKPEQKSKMDIMSPLIEKILKYINNNPSCSGRNIENALKESNFSQQKIRLVLADLRDHGLIKDVSEKKRGSACKYVVAEISE